MNSDTIIRPMSPYPKRKDPHWMDKKRGKLSKDEIFKFLDEICPKCLAAPGAGEACKCPK